MPLLAYIDPGSGTMLLQIVLAGLIAVPFFFRRVIADGWRRVRGGEHDRAAADGGEDVDSRS